MEYILYCDESSSEGPKYSDFFGGCIINSADLKNVESALNAKKDELSEEYGKPGHDNSRMWRWI